MEDQEKDDEIWRSLDQEEFDADVGNLTDEEYEARINRLVHSRPEHAFIIRPKE